jgi:hypothetical protein
MSRRRFDLFYTELCTALDVRLNRYQLWLELCDRDYNPVGLSRTQVLAFVDHGLKDYLAGRGHVVKPKAWQKLRRAMERYGSPQPRRVLVRGSADRSHSFSARLTPAGSDSDPRCAEKFSMKSDDSEPLPKQVLVLASPDEVQTTDFSRRVRECGVATTLASDFEDARRILSGARERFGAILVPTQFDARSLKTPLCELVALASPENLRLISYGPAPDKRERKKLRKLGVQLALWAPLSESQIRIQINRALNTDCESLLRRENPRVPTNFDCRVTVADRQKPVTVYSLAETGAYLSTPRASMTGSKIEMFFRPEGHTLNLQAEVVYANVHGNLRRSMLPLGMGVHFAKVDRADRKTLRAYIASRITHLEV